MSVHNLQYDGVQTVSRDPVWKHISLKSVTTQSSLLQVMLGALSLQLAEAEPDTPSAMASLSTAQKMLTQALSCKDKLGQRDSAVVCWLLARTELVGTLRRKQEKPEAHAMQVRLSFLASTICSAPVCTPQVLLSSFGFKA